jgi:hypothetical protein
VNLTPIGPAYFACKDPECSNAEFRVTTDGRIICSDSECFAEYGRLAEEFPVAAAEPSITVTYDLPPIAPGKLPAPQLAEKWANRDGTQERTEEGQ